MSGEGRSLITTLRQMQWHGFIYVCGGIAPKGLIMVTYQLTRSHRHRRPWGRKLQCWGQRQKRSKLHTLLGHQKAKSVKCSYRTNHINTISLLWRLCIKCDVRWFYFWLKMIGSALLLAQGSRLYLLSSFSDRFLSSWSEHGSITGLWKEKENGLICRKP